MGALGIFNSCSFLFGSLFLMGLTFQNYLGDAFLAYFFYVLKEVYIVLLVHGLISFSNSYYNIKTAKSLLGPLGAIGSLGGILGGLLLSNFVPVLGTRFFVILSSILIFVPPIFLKLAKFPNSIGPVVKTKFDSPFESIGGVKAYVLLICLVVAISQFCIGVATYKFDLYVTDFFPLKDQKTAYMAKIFTTITTATFFFQIFLTPVLLKYVSLRALQLFFPLFFTVMAVVEIILGGQFILLPSVGFILYKAFDYSLFSSSKEILYYHLTGLQKFGAKYFADMFSYRFSKGLVALLLIFLGQKMSLAFLGLIFLIFWGICVILLFRIQSKIKSH